MTTTDSTTTDATTTPCPLTPRDMMMSLTGFDEIAVAAHFGQSVTDLRADEITLGRALVFVHKRRDRDVYGDDKTAHDAAMNLTMGEVIGYFAKSDDPASAEGNAPEGS